MEKWKLKEYKNCYCYERNGLVYTYLFRERTATHLPWIEENKTVALQILRQRVEDHLGISKVQPRVFDLLDDFHKTRIPLMSEPSQKKAEVVFNCIFDIDNFELTEAKKIRDAILKKVKDHKLANNTRRKYLSYARMVFNYGIENGFMVLNPINKSIIPSEITKPIIPFKIEEIELILKKLLGLGYYKTYGVVLFSRFFGTRISETLSITWDNLDGANVTFRRKGGKIIELPYDIFPELVEYFDKSEKQDKRVFPISSQITQKQFKRAIVQLNKEREKEYKETGKYPYPKINSDLSFHAIRKMRENELIKKYKNDPKLVADFMGHTLAVQMKHYLTVLNSHEMRESLIV